MGGFLSSSFEATGTGYWKEKGISFPEGKRKGGACFSISSVRKNQKQKERERKKEPPYFYRKGKKKGASSFSAAEFEEERELHF